MPITESAHPTPSNSNYILSSLSEANFARLAPHLKPCLLHLGNTLYEKGEVAEQVYFLKTGIVSLILTSQTGIDVEVGLIGREGSVGAQLTLVQHPMDTRAIVQIAGSGWRISANIIREECQRSNELQTAILRAAYTLGQQTSQCVLCNRLHTVEKRLARWLLMCQDRMSSNILDLTHEFIANMLGTRRVGVTLAAGALRDAGVIEYSRGRVTIIDRAGLEERACECYAVIRAGFDSLMSPRAALPNPN